MNKREILIVEDDVMFAQTLEDFLTQEGFSITLAFNAKEALDKKFYNRYDLALFDINIPYQNGIELLSDLKKSGDHTPTIFITSYKDIDTLKRCFENGASDYMKKPIELDELLCRIENIFRHIDKDHKRVYLGKNTYYIIDTRTILSGTRHIKLPKKVLLLLEFFIINANKLVTKEQIVDHIWSASDGYSEGSIRVYINHLKKYIDKDKFINIKGIGYKFILSDT